jgi:ribonucleoside-diphosphate reductase alpha chain
MPKLDQLKQNLQAPEWLTEEALSSLKQGYLQKDETPLDAYKRAARTVANALNKPHLESVFVELIWKNWLCPSSPVLSNLGTQNLPISCYGGIAPDDTFGIMDHISENVMLTKYGGGIGSCWNDIRARGAPISRGGYADGPMGFIKMEEVCIDGTRQGGTRRGSIAAYLALEHKDSEEFIDLRKPTGDLSKKCLTKTFHNAITIEDSTMEAIVNGDKHYRDLYNKALNARVETGEPYLYYTGNANKNTFERYVGRNKHSNLCAEIFLPSSYEETFVCCLSSLNLARYREWEKWICPVTNYSLVQLSIMFLDGVMTQFINQIKSGKFPGLERAGRFAENHRALGLGVLGWHTLLQQEMLPFSSFKTMMLNSEVFKKIKTEADSMSMILGSEYGECKETLGTGRRNTVTLAIAPTMSNSLLSGGVSQGIEPTTSNLFVQKSAKGNFIKKNSILEAWLKANNMDDTKTWEQINKDMGSIRNIKQIPDDIKNVFLTAREIDQYAIIQQASQRQKFIDQGQSINLFFALPEKNSDKIKVAKYIKDVHLEAWKLGVKSLYYLKTASPIKGQQLSIDKETSCLACEG